MTECYKNIRFSLSDRDGELRFISFDIVGMPACRSVVEEIRDYLLGLPLDQVDPQRIRSFTCAGCEGCVPDIIALIEEDRQLFRHSKRPGTPAPGRSVTAFSAEESGGRSGGRP
jgi:hypothetical protein